MRRLLTCVALLAALPLAASAQTIGAAGWPSERAPRPLASRPVAFPPYQLKTLANGLQVLAIPWHEQPSVSMRLIIKAGASQDPQDKPGVANMVASLLNQGTTMKSAEGIANLVESSGGVLGVGAGNELSFVNAGVIKDKVDALMALSAELVQQPAFDQRELDRQKQQAMSGMQVSYDDPEFVAGVVYDRLIYGFHPYGRPPGGTLESIAKISRNDLIAFHRTWFAPNNSILAIVGDLTADEMFASAEKAFGAWPKRDVPVQTQVDPPPPTYRVVVVDKPGAVQTEIRAGNLTLARTSPKWLDVELLIRVLGGEGANRLFGVLRSERGLTYGASADLQTFKFSGGFVASTNTRTETTGEALRLLIDEMWRLQREKVDPRELRGVKDYFQGSFPLTIETPSAIALQVLNQIFYGLDLKDLEQLRDRVENVTVEDLQAAARQFVKPDRLSIVLVGDASKFVGQLRAQGFNDFERIPIEQLDLTSPTLRKGGTGGAVATVTVGGATTAGPVAAVSSATSTRTDAAVAAIVEKVAEAKGGVASLRALKTLDVSANVTISGAGAPVKMQTRNLVAYPDKFRVEAESPDGKLVQVYAGSQAWLETPAGTMDADAEARTDYQLSAARDLVPLLINAIDGKVRVSRLPDESVAGDSLTVLQFSLDAGGPLVMLVDQKTFDVRGVRYPTDLAPNSPQAAEFFEDYREVSGLRVAFRARVERDGVMIDRQITSARMNVALPATAFVRKAA
ncbi:MAG: insulinase family protein [Acidobacteria bacterium]|nr:insulinase family protein [Acidobacteriota bacterium]